MELPTFGRLACVAMLLLALADDVTGHGGLVDPPMRSYIWKEGFDAPINYDWNALFCGGYAKFQKSGGKCGLCGDAYDGPFDNDKGGVYDTGIIVRHYPAGLREIEVKVEITAHHKGYFAFKLCPNNERPLTKSCLDRYPLVIREAKMQGDPYRYRPPPSPTLNEVHVQLPPDVTCDRCVLQWTYTAGNSAGTDKNGTSCIGCGLQETFVNCADISIGGTVDTVPVAKNTSGPVEEVVIPRRKEIVELIRGASPETPIRDILAMVDGSRARSRNDASSRVTKRRRPAPTNSPTVVKRTESANIRRIVDTKPTPIARPPAVRRGRTDRNRRKQTLSRGRSSTTRKPRNRSRVSRKPTAHGRDRPRPRTNPPRSAGIDLSLLESMGRTVDELHGHGLGHLMREPVHPSSRPRPQLSRSPFIQTGLSIFGNSAFDNWPVVTSIAERVPGGVQWRRGDGRTSHRDAVRRARTFGRTNMPMDMLQRHVPDIPLDILPRQDLDPMQRRRASAFSENWFPESRDPLRSQMTRSQPEAMIARERIPRRIVVHSMTVAQHLLRTYPQLKGRVYLSPEAHARNVLNHMAHKYRRRQRWQ